MTWTSTRPKEERSLTSKDFEDAFEKLALLPKADIISKIYVSKIYIPSGTVYKTDWKGKTIVMASYYDIEEINKIAKKPTETLSSFTYFGIPIIESEEMVREILFSKLFCEPLFNSSLFGSSAT